jgi:hypothetical protein
VTLTDTGVAGQFSFVEIESDALRNLTLDGVTAGVGVQAAAGVRTESVTVDGTGPGWFYNSLAQGAWLQDNTVTTMNFHAVSAASQLYILANSLQSITFRDDVNFTVTDLRVGSSLTSVTIEGRGSFTDYLPIRAQASIDASHSRGDISLPLLAGQTYIGGSGNDVIDITGIHVLTSVATGRGSASVSLGDSLAHVTFGGRGNTLTADGTQASFGTDTTSSQAFVSTANLDVIKGLRHHDALLFAAAGANATVETSSNLAGVSGNIEFAHGSFNEAAQTFTANASGHDTLVTYGTTGDFVSVVLVGVDQHALPASLSNHALRLG